MKIATAVLASITVLGLLSACGDDVKVSVPPPTTVNAADDASAPDDTALGAGGTFPSDFSVPQETIDLMIAQFEAAGMTVDKECFEALLTDEGLRELAAAGGQGTPSPELTQKFLACMTAGG